MNNLIKLKGAKLLSKTEQKSINGGLYFCKEPSDVCPPHYCCNTENWRCYICAI